MVFASSVPWIRLGGRNPPDFLPPGVDRVPNTYVVFDSCALQLGGRLPLWITLDKLDSRGGVAQWLAGDS